MFQCNKCIKNFKKESTLQEHHSLYHELGRFVCAVCNKVYKFRVKFIIHYRYCHRPYKYSCKICKKLFSEKRKLEEHQDTHLGKAGRLFECNFCGNRYKTKRYLKEHIERKHLKTEAAQIRVIVERLKRVLKPKNPLPCDECPKKFTSKSGLLYHQRRVHSDLEKTYCCNQCGKTFAYERDLALHTNNYHFHKICKICGSKITANRFKQHMRSHTGERNHICLICAAAFSRKDLLTKHLFTHSKTKPFNCNYCSKGFYDRTRCINHVAKFHSDMA